jgi:uncharacterized membrane protein YidH (DUF202 family)
MDDQTRFAIMRTRFSAERTLMSWIRTAFSMITFGFGILKFFQYLHSNNPDASSSTKYLGIFLILLGILCLFPGMIEHRKVLVMLHTVDETESRWSYAFIVAILVGIIGFYALANALAIRLF